MNTPVQKETEQTPNSLWMSAKHEAMGTTSGSRNFTWKIGVWKETLPHPLPLSHGFLISACLMDVESDLLQMFLCFYFTKKINKEAEWVTHFYVRVSPHREVRKWLAKTRCCHGSQVQVLRLLPCEAKNSEPAQPLTFNTWLDPICTSGSDTADPPQPGGQRGFYKEELGQIYKELGELCPTAVPHLVPSRITFCSHALPQLQQSPSLGGTSQKERGLLLAGLLHMVPTAH